MVERARRESESMSVNPLTSDGQTTILRNQGRILALREFFETEKLALALEKVIENENKIKHG